MDGPAEQRSVLRISGFEILHHLLLAATISCALLLVESSSLYRALDNFTHFMLGSSRFRERWGETATEERPKASLPIEEYPQVLIIPEDLQGPVIGPPSKSALAQIIQKAIESRPRAIVVAYDVAPFAADMDNNVPDDMRHQLELNRTLDYAASQGVRVVILAPVVGSDPVGQIRYDWLRERCAAGIHFGLPVSRPPELPIYDYSRRSLSVGMVASRMMDGHGHGDDFNVCATADAAGRSTDDFIRRIREEPRHHRFTTAVALNTAFFARNDNLRWIAAVPPTPLHPEPTMEIGRDLPDSAVVFIGEDASRVRTFGDEYVSPVVLFAAEFFSEKHPVEHSVKLGFLVHMGLGVLLGYLFGVLWRKQAVLTAILKRTSWSPFSRKLIAYVWARGWLLLVLASLPLILIAIFSMSGWMLRREIWLNPLPLAIGMFIDALLHSYEGESHKERVTLRKHLNEHPDMALQLLFVAFVLVKVFVFGPEH
jgi:hypothetical protein